jgi:CubicO group peptidase (beta-lactamase class C family)
MRTLLCFLLVGTVAHAGEIDPVALGQLIAHAEDAKSDALVVMKDGKLVGEWHFGRADGPIETMSMTKSIVNLAIGRLVDMGKIKSIDEPVHTYFPEWRQGNKKSITIRHLLNHTSGLQAERTTNGEIYPSPDFLKLALAAELSDPPGTKFFYNNKAVAILAGIVQQASGKRMDLFVRDELLAPLGITQYDWKLDKAGNPHALAGFRVRAVDLAKIGAMLADDGVWEGKRLVSHAWMAESTKPGQAFNPSCGLLWWLLPAWRKVTIDDSVLKAWRDAKLDEAFIAKVLPMKDKVYERDGFFAELAKIFGDPKAEEWHAHTWKRGLPDGKLITGPTIAFEAQGWLGQYLIVMPKERLVAVRMVRATGADDDEKKIDSMWKFPELVLALVKH